MGRVTCRDDHTVIHGVPAVVIRMYAVAAALVVVLAACSADGVDRARPSSTPVPTATSSPPAATPAPPAPPAPEDLVARDDAILAGTRVERVGRRTTVTTLWTAPRSNRYVLARSDDGFATATYERVSQEVGAASIRPRVAGSPDLGGCASVAGDATVCNDARADEITWRSSDDGPCRTTTFPERRGDLLSPTTSLRPDLYAVMAGGDGATLFPFDAALRSTDAGETWTTTELPTFDRQQAYLSGAVVLADGRLLALLPYFSDDHRRPLPARHRLLWVSDGDDWASLAPARARFRPPLSRVAPTSPPNAISDAAPLVSLSAAPGRNPLTWVETTDRRLYVSSDGARTFTEIPAR